LDDPLTRKSALLEIEKTAVSLASTDRSEVTPIVVEVCTQTADMLNSTVLGGILREHHLDEAAIDAARNSPADQVGFAQCEAQRAGFEAAMTQAEANVAEQTELLEECILRERAQCPPVLECEEQAEEDCVSTNMCEEELRELDEEIHSAWCQEHAGHLEVRRSITFRSTSAEVGGPFDRYMRKWEECRCYFEDCTPAQPPPSQCPILPPTVPPVCVEIVDEVTATIYECDSLRTTVDTAVCTLHMTASGDLALYQQCFMGALDYYNDVVSRIMIQEADRKVEWDTVTRIICLLLTLTGQDDGDAAAAETEGRIQACWDTEVDVTHLDLCYPAPPGILSLPDLPPMPCSTGEVPPPWEIGDPLAPPTECLPVIEHTGIVVPERVCSCDATEVVQEELDLGHYLLVDPDMELTLNGNLWNVVLGDETFSGAISAVHTQAMPVITSAFRTEDEIEQGSVVAAMAWAYPSSAETAAECMSVQRRFAANGGLLLLDSANQVIEVRELASSSGALGQPSSSTMAFGSSQDITDEQAAQACPGMQPVHVAHEVALGAQEYCWIMGTEHVPACGNGCFLYKTATGNVAFPLTEGLYQAS